MFIAYRRTRLETVLTFHSPDALNTFHSESRCILAPAWEPAVQDRDRDK